MLLVTWSTVATFITICSYILGESKVILGFLTAQGVGTPNPYAVQGSIGEQFIFPVFYCLVPSVVLSKELGLITLSNII